MSIHLFSYHLTKTQHLVIHSEVYSILGLYDSGEERKRADSENEMMIISYEEEK